MLCRRGCWMLWELFKLNDVPAPLIDEDAIGSGVPHNLNRLVAMGQGDAEIAAAGRDESVMLVGIVTVGPDLNLGSIRRRPAADKSQ